MYINIYIYLYIYILDHKKLSVISNNMIFLWTFSDVTWGCENFLFILFVLLVYVEKCMNLFSSIEFYKTVPEDILTHTLTLTR